MGPYVPDEFEVECLFPNGLRRGIAGSLDKPLVPTIKYTPPKYEFMHLRTNSLDLISAQINEMYRDGWVFHGGMSVSPTEGTEKYFGEYTYHQILRREKQ